MLSNFTQHSVTPRHNFLHLQLKEIIIIKRNIIRLNIFD